MASWVRLVRPSLSSIALMGAVTAAGIREQSGGDVAVIEALGDQRGDLTFALAKQALDGIGGISGIVGIGRIRSSFGELASTSAPSTT